jgi:ATP synthase protein I
MSDGTRGEEDRSVETASEAALSARLRRLGQRLDRVDTSRSDTNVPGARSQADPSALGRALRLSAELIGGVIVGTGIGWGIDRLLGTSPWAFILFLLLGFAGGVLSVMRSAGVVPPSKF